MLTLLQMAFLGVYISKILQGACPRTPLGCLTPSALVCMTIHTTLASPLRTGACLSTILLIVDMASLVLSSKDYWVQEFLPSLFDLCHSKKVVC
jgi:hypothetical protein